MTDINPATLAQQSHPVASAATALIGDPSRFGRVAEDGTVIVTGKPACIVTGKQIGRAHV